MFPVAAVRDRRKFLELLFAQKQQDDAWPGETLLIRRDENVLARKLLEQGCRLAKIRGQNINRIAGDPRRKINCLVSPRVKTDQYPTQLATDVFNRVPVSLRDITDIAGLKLLCSESTVRPKHCHG